MMKRIMMKQQPKTMSGKNKKMTVIAAAVTTLLSATAAFIAIKVAKKAHAAKEDKSEFETALDALVEEGTITQTQQVAIQSAITTAKEASTANADLTSEYSVEYTTAPGSSKTGTLTKLKKSLLKVVPQQLKKPAQEIAM